MTDTPSPTQILTERLNELLEREAGHLKAAPEEIMAALAMNTAGMIFRHYRVVDRPQARVQFAGILSGALKRMDSLKEAGAGPDSAAEPQEGGPA